MRRFCPKPTIPFTEAVKLSWACCHRFFTTITLGSFNSVRSTFKVEKEARGKNSFEKRIAAQARFDLLRHLLRLATEDVNKEDEL